MTRTFRFRFQLARSMRYIMIMVFGPFAAIPLAFWIGDISFVPVIIAVLLPMIAGLVLTIRKGKGHDEIDMDDNGFNSLAFGRIDYADVTKVGAGPWWAQTKPSMRLTLRSGKKITWLLVEKGSLYNSVEDAAIFREFTEALAARLDILHRSQRKRPPVSQPAAMQAPETGQETPAGQLRNLVKRNGTAAWTIPIGLAFGLVALVRSCGSEWFRKDGPDFSKLASTQARMFGENVAEAKEVMARVMKGKGGVFLYSNDPAATVRLVPDIDDGNPSGLPALQHVHANENLRKYIENPDSFDIRMVMTSGEEIKVFKKSILNMDDSAKHTLYFRFADTSLHIISPRERAVTREDSLRYPAFEMSTAVALYDTLRLDKAIEEALPAMRMMLAQVRHRPTFRLYLAGAEKDGINEALFKKALRELNRQLNDVKADTSRFVYRRFAP